MSSSCKRLFTFFNTLFILVAVTFLDASFAYCVGDESEVVDKSVCSHQFVSSVTAPDCVSDGYTTHTCQVCSYTYTDSVTKALGHDYVDCETIPATCVSYGKIERRCKRCSHTESWNLPKTQHTVAELPAVEPTCTQTGLTVGKKCSFCEKIIAPQTVRQALGHNFSAAVPVKVETCTESGIYERQCTRCGEKRTETTAPLGHDYVKNIILPTCTEKGYTLFKCKHCSNIIRSAETEALGHYFSPWLIQKEASCVESGLEVRTCYICDNKQEKEISKSGVHTFDDGKMEKLPSCTQGGIFTYTCLLCGTQRSAATEKLGHLFESGYTIDLKPTCTKAGSKSRHCKRCGETKNITKIAPLGHKTKSSLIKATLKSNGKKLEICSVCKRTIKQSAIKKISSVTLSYSSFTYSGKSVKPSVTVKDSAGKKLKISRDYTVSYPKTSKAVGKYSITVKFCGNYSGSKKLSFKIAPRKPGSLKAKTTTSSSVTLQWAKVSEATGYEVYKYNEKIKKYDLVLTTKTTKAVIKKLKSKKKYKFKVRAYKKSGSQKFCSSCAAKTVKTR